MIKRHLKDDSLDQRSISQEMRQPLQGAPGMSYGDMLDTFEMNVLNVIPDLARVVPAALGFSDGQDNEEAATDMLTAALNCHLAQDVCELTWDAHFKDIMQKARKTASRTNIPLLKVLPDVIKDAL